MHRFLVPFAVFVCFASSAQAQTSESSGTPPAPPPAAPAAAPPPPAAAPVDEGNHPAKNAVYAEGLGAGLAYSVNYERLPIDDLAVRVGLSYLSVSASAGSASSKSTFMTFPVTASYVGLRGRKSALEVGGGLTFAYASGSASTIGSSASGSGVTPYGVAMLGYRLHPVDGAGFQFRIGAMALVGKGLSLSANSADKVGVLPWGYISFGAGF